MYFMMSIFDNYEILRSKSVLNKLSNDTKLFKNGKGKGNYGVIYSIVCFRYVSLDILVNI